MKNEYFKHVFISKEKSKYINIYKQQKKTRALETRSKEKLFDIPIKNSNANHLI